MLNLSNKRILVTQAKDFMGPAICEELRACGAEVVSDERIAHREILKFTGI